MADIYIPIDSSPAKNIIPPGEDIIYSTKCQIKSSGGVGSPAFKYPTKKWISHVLLTNKGLAYINHVNRCIYFDWVQVRGIRKKKIEIFLGLDLTLKRDPQFETEEGFEKRKEEFANKIKPIMDARKDEWLKKFPKKKERKKEIRKRSNEIIRSYNDLIKSLR